MCIKKTVFPILVLLLVCLCTSALADIWYAKTPNGKSVNIRDENGNVIGQLPYGESIIPDGEKSTETAAYIEYGNAHGYVKWTFLTREKPEPRKKATTQSVTETGDKIIYGEGQYSVTVTGGVLQLPNKKGKGTGTKYTEVKFDEPVSLVVTASIPKKKKIDYWVINGVKIQLKSKSFGFTPGEGDVTIEIVYK